MSLDPSLLDALPDGLCRLDRGGIVRWTNATATEWLGDVVGKRWTEIGDLPSRQTEQLRRLLHIDGTLRQLRCRATPLRDGTLWTLEPAGDSSEQLRALFDQAPVALTLLMGPEHRFQVSNRAHRAMFLENRDPCGKTVVEMLPGAAAQGFVALLDHVYRTGERFVAHETVYELGGEQMILNFVYEPFRGPGGEVIGILAVIRDVTQQVRAREQVQQTSNLLDIERSKLETIFTQTPAAMALFRGEELVAERVNPGYQAIYGDRQLLGRPLLEGAPELDGQGFGELLLEVFRSGISYQGTEALARISPRQGAPLEAHYYDFSYHQVRDHEDRPYGVYTHSTDVTDRVLARQKLEENQARLSSSEEQLTRAVEVSGVGFYDWNIQTDLVKFSPQMQRAWGIADGHPLQTAADRIHPEDRPRVLRAIEESVRTLRPYRSEYRVVHPEGHEIWVDAQGEVFADEAGRALRFFGTALDITDSKRRQQELEAAKTLAEHANETKSSFLANMSHEIRTPLGSILGFTDLLKDASLDPQDRAQFLDIISRNGRALSRIIDDILDLAKVESGKLVVERIPFSFLELVHEVLSVFGEKARDQGIALVLGNSDAVPERICSDPTRLRQILLNIVGNAVKFTHQGTVTLSWDTRQVEGGIFLGINVRDTGVGIPLEQRDQLFQPFVQADNSTTRKYGGTGLGLALSDRLAQALGGRVELLHNPPGVTGCTFRITLFTQPPAGPADSPSQTEISPQAERALAGLRLLVADDQADNRLLLQRALARHGADLTLVENGQSCVDAALQRSYDAILLDLQMPHMDGYEALRRLRDIGYSGPVLALTAHAMAEERARTRAAGFDGHLTKPVDQPELLRTLTRVTRQG